ncbi:MAG: TRAP transporter substrate-binding protein DctP [Alphaproteobacteria bacterium]
MRSALVRALSCTTGALAMLAAAGTMSAADAQQTVKLTFVSGYPPSATFVGSFLDHYVKDVAGQLARTGKYKIDWNLAHSGQIAKPRGEIEALQSGLVEIAVIPTPAHFDRVPLYQVPYATPFTTDDTAFLVTVIEGLEKKFPQYEAGWKAMGIRAIAVSANVDNYVLLTKTKVTKIADFKGMKIGAVGANMHYVTSVGATGVTALATDWYPGLNSGLYEGIIGWKQVIGSFKLCEAAKFMLDGHVGSSSPLNLAVNPDALQKMPEEVRNAILAAAPSWHKGQIQILLDGAKAGLEYCTKEQGMTLTDMSPADTAAWAKGLPPLGLEWAKVQDAKGLPGTGVLNAYMEAMRAGKQRVVRNWDKE